MASSVINSDDGVISGTSGLKSSGGDDGVLVFQSKGTETARINTDKQIVAAAGTASLPALTTTGDVNTGIFFPAADTIAFAEGGAEAMRITDTGTVAIGTTTKPTAKLWVESGRLGLTNTYKLGWHSNPAHADLGNYITGDDATNYVELGTSGSERARITSNGTIRFVMENYANGVGNTNYGWELNQNGPNPFINHATNGTGASTMYTFINDNGSVGSISTNGSSTAYNVSSDYRLKENVAPMTGALSKVAQLKPCTFTWKVDGSASQGFIAHELQEVVPECVTGEKDAVEIYTDEEGNEQTRIKPQGVDTSFLVATLTAAIQELKAELDEAKARIAALEAVPGNE